MEVIALATRRFELRYRLKQNPERTLNTTSEPLLREMINQFPTGTSYEITEITTIETRKPYKIDEVFEDGETVSSADV
jgi:hypothetical protein